MAESLWARGFFRLRVLCQFFTSAVKTNPSTCPVFIVVRIRRNECLWVLPLPFSFLPAYSIHWILKPELRLFENRRFPDTRLIVRRKKSFLRTKEFIGIDKSFERNMFSLLFFFRETNLASPKWDRISFFRSIDIEINAYDPTIFYRAIYISTLKQLNNFNSFHLLQLFLRPTFESSSCRNWGALILSRGGVA